MSFADVLWMSTRDCCISLKTEFSSSIFLNYRKEGVGDEHKEIRKE